MALKLSDKNKVYILVVVIFAIFTSQNFTSVNVDFALHYTLVERLFTNFDLSSGYVQNLGEMALLPRLAHIMTGGVARLTGSPILAINIVTVTALGIGWYAIARFLADAGLVALAFMAMMVTLLCTQSSPPLFGMEVVGSYLFSQHLATAMLLYLLYRIYSYGKINFAVYLVCLVGFSVGLFTHATFSLFFFSGLIFHLFVEAFLIHKLKLSNIHSYLPIFFLGIAGLVIFTIHPYFDIAYKMKMHEGALGFTGLTNAGKITSSGYLFIAISLSLPIFLIGQSVIQGSTNDAKQRLLRFVCCILFGGAVICVIQFFFHKTGHISSYVVKKNFFGIGTFLLMAIAVRAEIFCATHFNAVQKKFHAWSVKKQSLLLPCFFIFMCLKYWSNSLIDYSEFRDAQQNAKFFHMHISSNETYRNTIARFENLPVGLNFLISLGDLKIAKDTPPAAAVVFPTRKLPDDIFILTELRKGKLDNGMLSGRYRIYAAETLRGD